MIQKCEYLLNEKRYSKNENAILLYFEKPFKWTAIIVYFIGTLIYPHKEQTADQKYVLHVILWSYASQEII